MTNALKLAALLLAGMAACAVTPDNQSETSATSTLASELATTGSEGASTAGAITPDVTCASVWECDLVCGTYINGVLYRYPTNVLHRECDDGSDTVIRTDPCGEACF